MKLFTNVLFESKKYFLLLLLLIILFIFYHAIIYFFITSKIINIAPPYNVGDLSRMGYQPGSICLRKYEITLPKHHLEGSQFNYQKIDLITIGDSFSNGGGGGKNPFYQDYLASKYGYTVLNIRPLDEYKNADIENGDFKSILALINSSTLDIIHPKAILLEFGSRSILTHFNKKFDWNISISQQNIMMQIEKMEPNNVANNIPRDIFFINTANYKTYTNQLKYYFKPCLNSGACRLPLKTSLFNVKEGNILEFYRDDIKNNIDLNKQAISNINDNFNHLALLLKARGIKLYIMPIVDKHDLYQTYIINDPYQTNSLFDYFHLFKKQYVFINTKEILLKEVYKETKDIFYADDTHWSNLASDIITNEATFKNLTY
jgi:ABC-type transport system involved in multi-copper enzyme maturation permease subunit